MAPAHARGSASADALAAALLAEREDFPHFHVRNSGCAGQTGEMSWRKKPYEEGVANHFDPESCVGLPARAAAKR
jgi:hypothetical protein